MSLPGLERNHSLFTCAKEFFEKLSKKLMNFKLLIEGISVLVLAIVAMIEGLRLILYRDPHFLYDPLGPGIYILALSLGLMAVGVVHFIANYKGVPRKVRVQASEKRVQLFSSMGILALYILLVPFIGYVIATLIFFFLELRVSGVKSWPSTMILTLTLTTVYYIIFSRICGMVFPKGLLF